MNAAFTQIQFVKRKDYNDVIVYYSKNGEKFRPSTGVKVLTKNITAKGAISTCHPNYESDMKKIREVQDRVEDLVTSFKEKYGEKPSVEWLEKQFEKPLAAARKNLDDALCYWPEFINEKQQVTRNEGTIKRYNNLETTLSKFKDVKNYKVSFDSLDQEFFNDFLSYMVNEHEYVRNSRGFIANENLKPTVGLANETAIKRLKDFTEYLKFCAVEYDINVKLEKVKKFIKLAYRVQGFFRKPNTTEEQADMFDIIIKYWIISSHPNKDVDIQASKQTITKRTTT
jgi:hypothetical protein